MSAYTYLRLFKQHEPRDKWGLVQGLCQHLGASAVSFLVIYNDELRWGLPFPKILFESRSEISIEGAIQAIERVGGISQNIAIRCDNWSELLETQSKVIPDELANGYVPWDVELTIGPSEIRDENLNVTVAKPVFDVHLGGVQVPIDPQAYLSLIMKIPQLSALWTFLRQHDTGWEQKLDYYL